MTTRDTFEDWKPWKRPTYIFQAWNNGDFIDIQVHARDGKIYIKVEAVDKDYLYEEPEAEFKAAIERL